MRLNNYGIRVIARHSGKITAFPYSLSHCYNSICNDEIKKYDWVRIFYCGPKIIEFHHLLGKKELHVEISFFDSCGEHLYSKMMPIGSLTFHQAILTVKSILTNISGSKYTVVRDYITLLEKSN